MPIVSLLKEWSELEPEKCSYVGGIFAIRGWTLTHESEVSERLVNSEIQCAVQEAIESHGWNWYVGRVHIERGTYYKSRLSIMPQESNQKKDTPRLNIFLSTHSPTHVLLQAYVQALSISHDLPVNEPIEYDHMDDESVNEGVVLYREEEKMEPVK